MQTLYLLKIVWHHWCEVQDYLDLEGTQDNLRQIWKKEDKIFYCCDVFKKCVYSLH